MILHHYHQRTWPIAVALSVILTFVVVLGLMTLFSSGYSASDNGGDRNFTRGKVERRRGARSW